MSTTLPTFAISHGGGPWPWIKDLMPVDWSPLEAALAGIPAEVGATPKAVLVVTAHWEASAFALQTNAEPPMLYDYTGFPPETYQLEYPAPGAPEVAERTVELLADAGLPTDVDPDRGFDHGTFVPLYVMYPEADVPVVQMSIHRGFDPELHLAAGRALAPLREEGILIVGSGLPSYHNLSRLVQGSEEPSRRFDEWLSAAMTDIGPARSEQLAEWASAQSARDAHPREDHFLPLLVAVGAAENDVAVRNYHEVGMFGNTTSSGFRLGAAAA
ncbi:MAG: class III extradiol ring-cleavage dioxygenase [Actinomycetota bacterium]